MSSNLGRGFPQNNVRYRRNSKSPDTKNRYKNDNNKKLSVLEEMQQMKRKREERIKRIEDEKQHKKDLLNDPNYIPKLDYDFENLIHQKKLQIEKGKFQQNENGEVVLMDENEEELQSVKSNGDQSKFYKKEKNLSLLSADECYYFNDKKFNNFSIFETPCDNQEEMIKNNLSYISINDGSNGDNLEIIIKKARLVQKVLQNNQKNYLRKKWKLKNVIKIVENERNLKFLGNYFFDWKKTTENDGNNQKNKTIKNDVISENEEFVDANNIIDEFRLKIIANYSLKKKKEN